jgi:hypothetical protein
LARYRLWLPQYTDAPAPSLVPTAWPTWTFWQHSNTGTVPGVPAVVDLDRFCCADATLAALTGAGSGEAGGNPFGTLDAATAGPGTVTVAGWAIDPDTPAPILVHVYVDDTAVAATAVLPRPDVAAAFPGYGEAHGFAATVAGGAPGPHRVCAYAINTGTGTANALLGCRTATVPGGSPFGTLDEVAAAGPGTLTAYGWAIDPDTAGPVAVHVYIDGVFYADPTADGLRPDVGGAFPGYGAAHGYQITVPGLPGGPHTVCTYAINTATGTANAHLGCRTATLPGGNPFGALDEVTTAPGRVRASGWAIDPDTTGPIPVHLAVDDAVTATSSSGPRPDVAAAFPGYGTGHGYVIERPGLAPGPHRVCTFAINWGTGTANALLGCRTATTP